VVDLQTRLQAVLGDGYRIERELGGGGMSRVFLAHDVELARKVVVKVLPPDTAAGLNAERFRREIQMAASLQHPHIVPLIASGRRDDLVWYTMPFIEGESLRAKLARERELPVSDAVRLQRDVTDALSYAHDHGVVHRDIKPDNVLITGRHAVVTDFGVAKAVSASSGESSLTSIGVALGTPAYMAPEQASADPHVDHRADIYSLGVMAYEMLTGSTPFAGPPQMVLAAHVTQAPDHVSQRRATVPPALATIIMRSLEKKAADRYQSASELHQQFELMATPSGGAAPTTAVSAAPAVASRRPSWLIPAVAAGALVVAIASWVALKPASGRDAMALDPHVVAVLPFRVAGADPSLHYLRQGMLDLLQAKLTGEGGPRAADARSVLAAFRDAGGTDADDVPESGLISIAQKVGAARVVQGSIVGPPDHVVLSASLVEIPGARTLAQTSVEGPKDSLFAMVDQLAARLLALGAGASDQQLASLTTTSLDALRTYLDGVAAIRRGAFENATSTLTRAVQLDSTFALALSALIESHGWVPASIDMNRIERLAWQYRDRLAAKDQLILSIRVGSRFPNPTPWTERIRDREQATQQMPDSPEAWYYLGDALFHYGAVSDIGDHRQRTREAFLRAIRLDSAYGGPLEHLTSLVAADEDTAAASHWIQRVEAFDSTSRPVGGMLKWMRASLTGDPRQIAEALAEIDSTPGAASRLTSFLPFDSGVIANFDHLSQLEFARAASVSQRVQAMQARIGWLWNLGRPAEAQRWVDSIGRFAPSREDAAIGVAWYVTLFGTPKSLDSVTLPSASTNQSLFAKEVAKLSHGDLSSVDRTVAALSAKAVENRGGEAGRMAAVLAGWGASIRKLPTTTALLERADSAVRGWQDNTETYALILGRLWEEQGRFDKALLAIRRRHYPLGSPVILGLAEGLRLEGRIAAKAGDKGGAILAYERYLRMRANAEPSKVPQRDSVVAELAALKR
jgi:serine/threonine-protein kinase